jgi:uncharacterized membrane protein YuzA (DUF378 family)
MKAIHAIAFVLVIIGGLNWLLTAFNWNVVDAVFGMGSIVAKIIYILVGLSAIVLVATHKKDCKNCGTSSVSTPTPGPAM